MSRCNIAYVKYFMNDRTLVSSLLFVLLVAAFLTAQRTPDSTNSRLEAVLRVPVLTSRDW
jgi:hypothetical protein